MPEPELNFGAKTSGRGSNEITMADAKTKPAGSKSPPVTYKNPRRTSPETSITLRHHRMAREASERNALKMGIPMVSITGSPRRNSSDESNETSASNPRRWFDRANQNLTSTLDSSMDIDPPFFQKETESSNEEGHMVPSQSPAYRYVQSRDSGLLRPGLTHSSSAGDYRSVIDDLTIENKRLKEELKRYRQMGPDSLRRDKLFEVKVHGLPSRKKRELEAALRDFTTSIDGSSTGASPSRKKDKAKANKGNKSSKHASSSSGSNSRLQQTDSAYASMSIGAGSSGPSLTSKLSRHQSDAAAERYLPDVPEGLLPRSTALSEKEKKKMVVRRLEELFTGKGLGHTRHASLPLVPSAISEDVELLDAESEKGPPPSAITQASREAQILPRLREKDGYPRDNVSPSNSNEDRTDSRNTGSGTRRKEKIDTSPPNVDLPEQRATRPLDLDPDRPSIPSDNMHYIQHLGLVAPEKRKFSPTDVSADAEGWVYLNLLCDMAQLHMFNVTPSFIRAAVSEKSRQFQLSPDGRKIRWRGGGEGTKFSSDSSGSNSHEGSSSPDTDGSKAQDKRKKQKTQSSGNELVYLPAKLGPQVSSSSDEFHYKPMFAHHQTSSSDELPSVDEECERSATSSPEDPNLGTHPRWNYSGETGVSRVSQRKRRRDGAIIYYTGAPFCTDLSGDFGDISPDPDSKTSALPVAPPELQRSGSGSSVPFKPLSNYMSHRAMMDLDFAPPDAASDSTDDPDDMQAEFPWSNKTQSVIPMNLEASGIGGVSPDDHFVVVVSTRRPKVVPYVESIRRPSLMKMDSGETTISRETTESLVGRLATMSTVSPIPGLSSTRNLSTKVEFEYLSGKVRHLPPVPLPPPAFYFGSASSSFETAVSDSDSVGEDLISRGLLNCPGQAYSPDGDLSSNDEEDEHCDDDGDDEDSGSTSPDEAVEMANVALHGIRRHPSPAVSDPPRVAAGSSVATAGGAVSHGYSSTEEV